MKAGKSLERLIKHLEVMLARESGSVLVESPKRIPDITTGKDREHDVVITINEHHHELRIAVECRDRSRPITVNQVEGFWAKCQHTGINQGIIVSSRGFYESAIKKAEFLGIRCFNLEEATSFHWLLPKEMEIYRRVLHYHWTIIPSKEDDTTSIKEYQLTDSNGNEISKETLKINAYKKFDEYEKTLNVSIIRPITFEFNGNGLLLKDMITKKLYLIKKLIAKVDFEIHHEFAPILLVKYRDKQKEMDLIDAAIVNFSFGDKEQSLVITGKEGECKNVSVLSGKLHDR